MKVLKWNFARLLSCFYFIVNLIKQIFGRGRQRKNSGASTDNTSQRMVEGSNPESEWAEWENDEHFSIKIEPSNPPLSSQEIDNKAELGADDLFKDMTPVFKKAKKIVVKSKQTDGDHHASNSPSRLNFDMNFPPTQTDLGSWEDTSGGWEENEISQKEIEWETENVMKEKKQAERERRALEQQRRKEEREILRLAKQNQQHLGVKVNA